MGVRMLPLKNVFFAGAGILLSTTLCLAQTSTLSGTVYDPSRAVVGGALVTAINDGTGLTLTQATNEAGLYSFPSIAIGTYTLTIEIPGFKTARRTGITLNVGIPSVQNITLELGATQEAMTVEAAAAPVNTSNATIGSIVERAAIVTLPLNGRNPLNLLVLEPGVQQTGSSINVNGMRAQSGNVTIDGIEANQTSDPTPGMNVFHINPDNVQEFKVTTSNPTAEEGKNAGLNVAMATRSGTNDFHVSVTEHFRNTVLNANEFYANAQGNPRPTLKANQYGFDVSGPIRKNKTFFYASWQGQKINLELAIDKAGGIPAVYTPQALNGIYRYFVADPANPFTINGQRITANSPLLVKDDGSLADGVRNCASTADLNCIQSYNIFANDPLRIGGDAQVLKLLNSYPLANNFKSGDGLNTAGYLWNTPYQVRGPRNLIRVDHIFNSNNSMFFRVLWGDEQDVKGDPLNSRPVVFPGFPPKGERLTPAQSWVLSWRSVISPTKVNELTVGFARVNFVFTYLDSNPDGVNLPRFTPNNPAVHYVNQPHSIRFLNTPQIIDNFSWIRGAHQLKFGVTARFYQQNNQNASGANNAVPQISLSASLNPPGAAFGLPAIAGSTSAGIASADNTRLLASINDLLGIPAQLRAVFLSDLNTDTFNPSRTSDGYYSLWASGQRLKQWNGYAQDEWRARTNLTLNYGGRWEWNRPATESSQPIFVPDKPIDGSQGPVTFIRADKWWKRSNVTAISPRVGISWSPFSDKTVIRAGYGMSFDPVATYFAGDASNAVPGLAFACVAQTFASTTQGCASVPNLRLSQGFPTELPPPNVKPSSLLSPPLQLLGVAPSTAVIDPNLKQSTVHQWNLTIQHQIPGDMIVQLAYLGNRGERLYSALNINQVSAAPILPQFLAMQANLKAGCRPDGTTCPGSVVGQSIPLVTSGILTAAFVNSSATITDLNQNAAGNFAGRIEQNTLAAKLRPNQQFSSAVYLSNSADSVYHSMQVTLRKPFARGLLFNMAYTYSKAIDNHSSSASQNAVPTGNAGGIIDARNLRAERARANFDHTHGFITTWIYELPFGQGRRWMANGSKILNGLLGGWSIQGFNSLQSGSPFSILSGAATAFFSSTSRAVLAGDLLPDASLKTKAAVTGPVFFPDASGFALAAPGQIGMGRNTFTGPRYWDVDASISKTFQAEKAKFMFRLEAFNALNHTNFRGLGNATVGSNNILSPNFGTACCQSLSTGTSTNIVRTGEAARVVQALLKLSF
jgi:hypothetical protein